MCSYRSLYSFSSSFSETAISLDLASKDVHKICMACFGSKSLPNVFLYSIIFFFNNNRKPYRDFRSTTLVPKFLDNMVKSLPM